MSTLKPSSSSSSTSSSSSSAHSDHHKDKDDDDDRNGSKKSKSNAMTSPSAPPHLSAPHPLADLPDIPNMVLIELLYTKSLLRLSESSRGLRDAYDGHVQESELFWHQENSYGSFLNFLRRQQELKVLELETAQEQAELLPYLSRAITEMPLQLLQVLHYDASSRKQLILQTEVDIFVRALQNDALPLLESIAMDGAWEEGAIPTLLRGLKDGACPRLHTIKELPIRFPEWYVDENGDYQDYDEFDDNETDACIGALVEMLETRRSLGTCVGLKELPMTSMVGIPQAFRDRTLRATLPTLEVLPECDDWDDDEDLLRLFAKLGGPCLKRLEVKYLDGLQVLINKPGGFEQLQELQFDFSHGTTQAILREFQRFSLALKHGFWPHLQRLSVCDFILGGERWQELIDALITRHGAVESLQVLAVFNVELTDEDIDVLADAFTEGCFTHLKFLSLTFEDYVTNRGAARLAEVLHHAPLLETLLLWDTSIQREGCDALASAVVRDYPAMKELVLPEWNNGEETQDMVEEIIGAANREGTLTVSFK